MRFVKDEFVENYDPTIEEEYRRTVTVDGKPASLEVLDTAGAEQFNSLNEVYIKSAMGFILVFSLTQESTLKEVDNIRKQIQRIRGGDSKPVPIVIAGTKSDLVNEREVPWTTIKALSETWKLRFFETSAKKNWHVQDVFEDMVRQLRQHYPAPQGKHSRKKSKPKICTVM